MESNARELAVFSRISYYGLMIDCRHVSITVIMRVLLHAVVAIDYLNNGDVQNNDRTDDY